MEPSGWYTDPATLNFTPLQTMLQVVYAEIDEEAKRKIAGDNVRKLLEDVVL